MTDNPYNDGSPSSYAWDRGYRDGCSDTNRGLINVLNRLRAEATHSGPANRETSLDVAYLSALDDVAQAHGLRKEVTTKYVV
jgi:hypothetical protein